MSRWRLNRRMWSRKSAIFGFGIEVWFYIVRDDQLSSLMELAETTRIATGERQEWVRFGQQDTHSMCLSLCQEIIKRIIEQS